MTRFVHPSHSSFPRAGAIVVPVALAASLAHADLGPYEVIDLGTLGSGAEAVALDVNDARQVVGWSTFDTLPGCGQATRPCRRAYLWENGAMTDLGLLGGDDESVARAITATGLVVGTSEANVMFGFGDFHAAWWPGGTIAPLPDLGGGRSFVEDVNDDGLVVGWAPDPSVGRDRAVAWSAGAIQNIGAGEGHSYNRALAVNDAGVIVGFAWDLFQPNDAILRPDANAPWITIGGTASPFQNAEAHAVNDTGAAVGYQAFPSGPWHAAIWPENGPAMDLGVLPGDDSSEAYGVNDDWLVVGRSIPGDPELPTRAIAWQDGTLHDLNDLVVGFDGVVIEATAVNEQGDIAAIGLVDGFKRALLLVAAGAPCPTDLDGNGAVDFADLLGLLAAWGPCADCPADLDGDGDVAFADLLALLAAWGPCA